MKQFAKVVVLVFLTNFIAGYSFCATQKTFIRVNQLGYLEKDKKKAIVISQNNLAGEKVFIVDTQNSKIVYEGAIDTEVLGVEKQSPFPFNHIIDFSDLKKSGSYRIKLENKTTSPTFKVANNVYRDVIDNLLFFLRSARCGDTNPALHRACHLYDATNTDLDLTGGWHDAGDFLKFTRSVAYVTYTLLLSYEMNKNDYEKFYSDLNENGLADILDEAKIGLDYLVKLYPDDKTFILQVGDWADHHEGIRMPEHDKLSKTKRPAKIGFSRFVLSQYAFAMALASTVFSEISQYSNNVDKYLELAKRAYDKAKSIENGEFDKLCLAATELYCATQKDIYLEEAIKFNSKLTPGFWGNWSDNTIFAHARLGRYHENAKNRLKESVAILYSDSVNHLYAYPIKYTFSGLYVAITAASASWFYKLLSNDDTYNNLALSIRDYILGVNPWGVCFVSGLGTTYPKNIHNRMALALCKAGVLKSATIKGAIPGGPMDRTEWDTKWIDRIPKGKEWICRIPENKDIYSNFQPQECVYFDFSNAYPTNEPCIYGSSEAILFFSFYLRYLSHLTN
jgi:hypothetical protein